MPALDGLRGVAILMVVLTHCAQGWTAALSLSRDTGGWPYSLALPPWLAGTADSAAHGVQLFFVISAFTLTTRALSDQEGDLSGYFLRRVARVGPAYWIAALAYTFAFGMATPRGMAPHGLAPADFGSAAAFLSAWTGGASLAVVPGGWSVSCEVSFYIALPVLLWLINARLARALALAGLAMLAAKLLAKWDLSTGAWSFAAFANPLQQAPSFLCGIAAALLVRRWPVAWAAPAALPLLAFAIFLLPFIPVPGWRLQGYVPFSCAAAAVVGLAAVRPPPLLASRLMRRIGEVSYSMYLVHFAVLAPSLLLAERLFPARDWRTLLVHYAVTCAVAFLISNLTYLAIERPAIRWAAARTRRRPLPVPAAG